MGSLDQRAHISIALIVVYPFVFILALILVLRHGITRQAGWLFLVLFSTAKIVGAILHIVAEKQTVPITGLYIAAFAVEGAGLGPLLECTLSFLGSAGSRILDSRATVTRRHLRLLHVVISGALVISVVGAINSNTDDDNKKKTASTLRKIGGILFVSSFVTMFAIHLLFWKQQHMLMKFQRTLLKGISFALPFLAVRVLYAVLSAFSPPSSFSSTGITSGSSSGLAKFNSISGSWQLFLVMAVLMEFFVVAVYIFCGLRLPISKGDDYEGAATSYPDATSVPLYPQSGIGYYPPSSVNVNGGKYAQGSVTKLQV